MKKSDSLTMSIDTAAIERRYRSCSVFIGRFGECQPFIQIERRSNKVYTTYTSFSAEVQRP